MGLYTRRNKGTKSVKVEMLAAGAVPYVYITLYPQTAIFILMINFCKFELENVLICT